MGCFSSKAGHTKEGPQAQQQKSQHGGTESAAQPQAHGVSLQHLPATATPWVLSSIYDGDTIRVRNPNSTPGKDHEVRVRLLGVDTPELKEKEPFAQEARDLLAVLLAPSLDEAHQPSKGKREVGTTVYITPPATGESEDRYGRLLGVLYVPSPTGYTCVNAALLEDGLARLYEPTPGQIAPDVHAIFVASQLRARRHKRRIWCLIDETASVVSTTNGRAYHKPGCEHLHGGGRPTTVGAAIDRGLSACRTCHP